MVHDELRVVEDTHINPWLEGTQVGISFVVGGLIPTIPVIFSLPQARWWAYGLTALTALALGAVKARYTHQHPLWAGLESSPPGPWWAWAWACSCTVGEFWADSS